jgi:adenosylcobinamide-GDP ribazoletransferase
VAALLLVVWVVLSGALHVDGFLDACDGLLGGTTPEHRMEIMRDERIGAFAFTAGTLLFLTKFAVLATLSTRMPALLLAPVLGRWAISVALVAFPYARAEGLGAGIKEHAGRWQAALATVTVLAAAWFSAGRHGLAALLLAFIVMLGAARFTLKRIPGLTGDVYGLLNELVEITVLLTFAATR